MYLSHPVRRIREDPTPEAEIGLVVELDDANRGVLADAVDDAGGEIREDLRFDAFLVTVPEAGVDYLCALDGVERIETDATIASSSETFVEPTAGSDDR